MTDEVFPHNYRFEDGYLVMDEVPGLGVDIDEKLRGEVSVRARLSAGRATARRLDVELVTRDPDMLSVVVEKPNSMAVRERPQPEPAPAKSACACAMPASAARTCTSSTARIRSSSYPRVIGHEFVGRIDAVGEGVDRVARRRAGRRRSGDQLRPVPRVPVGPANVCRRLQVIGVHRDGGFSSTPARRQSNAYTIPPDVPKPASSIIEPFAVAANVTSRTGVFAERRRADLRRRTGRPQHAAGAQAASTACARFITDQFDERLALARACGAGRGRVINTTREPLPEALAKRGVDGGPTLIYDAVVPSERSSRRRCASRHRRGASACSASPRTPSAIPQQELTKKELTLYASRLNCSMFPTVIDWIQRGLVDPDRIITHRVDFRDVSGAFDLAETLSAHDLQGAARLRRRRMSYWPIREIVARLSSYAFHARSRTARSAWSQA